ncbi:hypothetical protein AMAG_18311 [Allomyces macrogynus ATCC 38327]|uniref:Bromo domain-containing protein n=1 Tax=Allomyces macrogynus (strain ATCC 38327) TaxID=578462 RepID=A0A0L0S884_ALLM3|nr:hypothetical protein AMAG_18311 [Allomyces macrogynus ATCC 38327]|eukprot:KNE58813.1 hypothetical protein AMAG_18311 [Allomyces macrogynus ATCC 38327]
MDMMEIFDSILVGVATMPEAKQFMVPLSAKAHPEYYARIKHPRFIQTIIENNKRLQYATADEFLKDIKLIHTNAVAIYGAEHAVAQAAASLGAYVVREVEHRSERLQDLAYATADEFLKDIKLIHTNAVAIYGAEHAVAQAARVLGHMSIWAVQIPGGAQGETQGARDSA